jgi:hypothetical protein
MPVTQPQQTYVGMGQFDPGARFDGVSSARVPVLLLLISPTFCNAVRIRNAYYLCDVL